MYKRILLAYDGSTEGRTALREGALLARRYRARVFLLSVITETAGTKMGEGVGGGGVSQQHEDYERVLQEGMARLKQLGFDAVSKLVIGEPAREIAAYAEQTGADLVIVGHRRQSAFGRWWSGPSGAYLVDHIRCSLLVCRNVISDAAFAAALAEVDASANSGAAARAAADGAAGDAGAAANADAEAADAVDAGAAAAAADAGAGEPATGAPAADRAHEPAAERPATADRTRSAASRRRMRIGLFLLLPIALLVGAYVYVTGGEVVSTDDAYVEANTVGVSTDVSGIVSRVYVSDNQRVEPGQILYTLDDLQYRYALNRANAQLGVVRNDLTALQANYRDMLAQIKQAQYDVDYNRTQFGRAQHLAKVDIVSRTGFDTAQNNLRTASQKLTSLQEQLAAIVANLNGDPSEPVERNPQYLAALAQRDEAARELAHTVVRAPFGGIVTSVPSVQPGKYLAASTTAFYLVDTDHVWVHANPKETELTYVRPGQSATVTVDTYPGARWRGVVESMSPAAAQQFALLPAQNTSGNWVKVVQRIPVRVRVDVRDRSLPPLSAGMSVELSIDTAHPRGLPRFLTALFGHGG